MEYVDQFVDFCTNFISQGGLPFGFLLIFLESFLPILPLGVFVALNVNAFGDIVGVLLSWVATCLGCFISYTFFSYISSNFLEKFLSSKTLMKVNKGLHTFQKISFSNLVLVIALPFTPAFLVNIICGIAHVSRRKFIFSILIGKVSMILFWGYVSKSLIESVTDINTIMIVSVMLIAAYLLSRFVNKKMHLD